MKGSVWIERNGETTHAVDVSDAAETLRNVWPDAVFLKPVTIPSSLNFRSQRVTHVHKQPRTDSERDRGPDAVIVEQIG